MTFQKASKKSFIFAVVILALLVVAVLVQNSVAPPPAQGNEDNGRVDQHEASVSLSPPMEATSGMVADVERGGGGGAGGKVSRHRAEVHLRSPQQLRTTLGGTVYRRRVVINGQGGNAMDRSVIRYNLSCSWKYDGSDIIGDPNCNTWGDADQIWLWSYDGISDYVKGHGPGCCGEQFYRRPYFKFSRDIQGVGNFVYPWVAVTMRGNGTCIADRMGHDGTVSCTTSGSW